MSINYKGFVLSPASQQLSETEDWVLRITITKHHDSRGETLEKIYTGNNTFSSKAEAEVHSIEFGKQIIDGKFQDSSIDELS